MSHATCPLKQCMADSGHERSSVLRTVQQPGAEQREQQSLFEEDAALLLACHISVDLQGQLGGQKNVRWHLKNHLNWLQERATGAIILYIDGKWHIRLGACYGDHAMCVYERMN